MTAAAAANQTKHELHYALETAFGPKINDYLNDPLVTEIYINPDQTLWIDRLDQGRINTKLKITPGKSQQIIKLISGNADKIINSEFPELATEIEALNCRCQAVVSPLVKNPIFLIRKHSRKIFTMEDYVERGTLKESQRQFLIECIKERKNILVVGSTGTGKTTFVNALLVEIAKQTPKHRLAILEDTPELQCRAEDYFQMETKKDRDPQKALDMNDLLFITMRLSPTRIIVGEIRDGAALTLLKAWNTGHPGGLCTTHADSAFKGLRRLEMLTKEAIPNGDFREEIAEAVNIVVSLNLVSENDKIVRKVQEIVIVNGWDNERKQYSYELFDK